MLFYTSATSCYLPKARVLGYSLKKYNPDAKFYLLLSDSLPENFDLSKEPFDGIIYADEIKLDIKMSKEFWFYLHDVTELCTAVKGWAALELLSRTREDKVVYLDPDMVVFHSFKDLEELLDKHDIVVTPHRLTAESKFDDYFYGDHQFYTRGVFNLGFLAVRNNERGIEFLNWWKKMLENYCYIDDPKGLFTDQKLIDLAPAFFDSLFICRDEGYNISWWNITQRDISGTPDNLLVNNKPVYIYHFSNYDSGLHKEVIEEHCKENTALIELFNWYTKQQNVNGQNDYKKICCIYDKYDNGEIIKPIARKMVRNSSYIFNLYKNSNPYDTKNSNSLYHYYSFNFPECVKNANDTIVNISVDYEVLYNQVINSRAYKVGNLIANFVENLIPRGSVRRKGVKKVIATLRNIKNSFNDPNRKDEKVFRQYSIPVSQNMEVSIIIPDAKNLYSVYNCLESILSNNKNLISYEIIISNGLNNEENEKLIKSFTGIRVSSTVDLNELIKSAQAPYIALFSENIRSSENFISIALTELKRENYGILEGKTVFQNGMLLEAGSIILKDGTRYSYGFKNNQLSGTCNYTKNVDCVLPYGCILNKLAFEKVNGLCIDFNNVYYRFADLSMKLRQEGYQTVYYPKAILWDIRDQQSVKDITEKEEAMLFRNKWKNVLDKEHASSKEQEFWARDRSKDKQTILFIDDRVPNFDKSAGDRTSYQYLEVLAHMGYNIKDIGNDFIHSEPYSSNLENLGIEIIGADGTGDRAWQEMLERNGQFLDYVYLTRPNIAQKFMSYLRKYTNAKIVYYCCDLHFLRLRREYELKNDQIGLAKIPEIEKEEIEICENADVVFTLSTYEQEILESKLKNPKVRLNPIFVYSEFPVINLEFTKREDLIFVGGFAHTPNVDAVKWFCKEVFPTIVKNKPNMRIHIVGSNPDHDVIALACNNIVVHGFMKDEFLMQLYNQCRIAVIPLRYGAGVKGKVLEAMYYGLPVVSTSVGLEGIENIDQYIAATDSAGEFSQKILELYDNVDELSDISQKNQEYIKEHYAQDKVEIFFKRIFAEV